MAKLSINISGRRGLVERHQGDLDTNAASPNLRYIGEEGQFADGIFNPLKKYGWLSPANNVFTDLTGTISAPINSIQYDDETNDIFLSEEGENILKCDGLDDTSVSNYLSVASGDTIKDMVIYEVNGKKAIAYVVDTGDEALEINEDTIITGDKNTYFGGVGGQTIGVSILGTGDDDHFIEFDSTPITNVTAVTTSDGYVIDDGTNHSRQLAQPFKLEENLISKKVRRVGLKLVRFSGTGSGITMKLTIQASATKSTSPYSDQGTWGTGTSYSVNDVVKAVGNGRAYLCYQAHTSSGGNDEPGVDANYNDYWLEFGDYNGNELAAPDGTAIATATVAATSIPDDTTGLSANGWTFNADDDTGLAVTDKTWFEFSSDVSLDARKYYWLVLEEDGTNMTSGDEIGWASTTNNNAIYDVSTSEVGWSAKFYNLNLGTSVWDNINANRGTEEESRDFTFARRRDDYWSRDVAAGNFIEDTGKDSFLFLSENALLYWFAGNKVHTIDGGITGGTFGRATKDALSFPSYINVVDVAETRSRMYLAIQSTERSIFDQSDYFEARTAGVFVWNRNSQIFGGTDFYPAPGAKEIKKVFRSITGDILAITINNSGFTELRAISGNQYAVIHTLEQNAFPVSRRGVGTIDRMNVWTGKNGIIYAYGSIAPGEPAQLYKIGDMSGRITTGFFPGPIFTGYTDNSETRAAILQAWEDGVAGDVVSRWFPHGDGTINSVAQTGNAGNVYTRAVQIGFPTKVRHAHIFFEPVAGGSSGTTVATVKVYYNHSTTAGGTWTITADELAKGYKYLVLGEANVYAIQFEVEWPTGLTLGSTDFSPYNIVVDYQEDNIRKK